MVRLNSFEMNLLNLNNKEWSIKSRSNLFGKAFLAICFLMVFSEAKVLANAAMPGYWNTGSAPFFVPMFPADATYQSFLSMDKEQVDVQLYRGYAVVKGTYFIRNRADSLIHLNMGYPVNGTLAHPQFKHLMVDDLYKLKVTVNGMPTETTRQERNEREIQSLDSIMGYPDNWFVWQAALFPDSLNVIQVWFLVETNFASLREGYNKLSGQAFSYILETGKAWNGNIGEGEIKIQLMDGLKEGDVFGIFPKSAFKSNGNVKFIKKFTALEPGPQDNIVIRYSTPVDGFDIEKVLTQSQTLFDAVDLMSAEKWEESEFQVFENSDFEIPQTLQTFFWIAVIIGFLIFIAFASVLFYVVFKLIKKKKEPA